MKRKNGGESYQNILVITHNFGFLLTFLSFEEFLLSEIVLIL